MLFQLRSVISRDEMSEFLVRQQHVGPQDRAHGLLLVAAEREAVKEGQNDHCMEKGQAKTIACRICAKGEILEVPKLRAQRIVIFRVRIAKSVSSKSLNNKSLLTA